MFTHLRFVLARTVGCANVRSRRRPRALVDSAIAAMQRSTRLEDARSVRLVGVQHEFMFGNAERSEGPWRVGYSQFTELRDVDGPRLRRTEQGVTSAGGKTAERVTILTDSVVALSAAGRQSGMSRGFFEDIIDRIDGSPDRALLLAAASPALRYEKSVQHYGLTYDVVSFPWRNGRMRLELSRETHLPERDRDRAHRIRTTFGGHRLAT